MSDKHLAAGEALPPLGKDKLRLYSMKYCPYAQRTRLVLAQKQIPFETVNVNLKNKPDWFFEKNPLGLVPILEYNDKIVYESAICDEFLDDKYPDIKMFPSDPYEKARGKILMDGFQKTVASLVQCRSASDDVKAKAVAELPKLLNVYEKALTGKYFGGESPNMVDVHIWPWFERIPMTNTFANTELLPKDSFPKLNQWVADMTETPMVKASYMTGEQHRRFAEGYMKGNPDYDMPL